MTRFAVLLTMALAGGCSVGEVPLNGGGGGDGGGTIDSPGMNAACGPRTAPATAAHQHAAASAVPNPPTAAGAACQACHITGGPATPFAASGTVYKPDKVTPQAGVTVRIFQNGGVTSTAITDDAGNFRFEGTIAFPATTDACVDTATALMVSPLNGPGEGNCNSAGCHQEPGGTYGAIKLTAD